MHFPSASGASKLAIDRPIGVACRSHDFGVGAARRLKADEPALARPERRRALQTSHPVANRGVLARVLAVAKSSLVGGFERVLALLATL